MQSHVGGGGALGLLGREGQTFPVPDPRGGILAVEGWMRPGPGTVGQLEATLSGARGEFAAVEWEPARRRLVLARDPMGVRPFYLIVWEGGLAFASEIKALLQHPRARAALDHGAVAEFLAYRYVAGSRTLLRGVRALEPGRLVVWQDGRVEERNYWDLPYARSGATSWNTSRHQAAAEAALREATQEAGAVSPRTGVLLSGGLDSSLVTALFRPGRRETLTWSAGSSDPRLDESQRAAFVAQALGVQHQNRPVDGKEYAALLPEAIALNDQPLHHPNAVALLLLARDAAGHVDALLMGEGADSSFGNRTALKLQLALLMQRVPATLSAALIGAAGAVGIRHASALGELRRTSADELPVLASQFTPTALARALSGAESAQQVFGIRPRLVEEGRHLDPVSRLLRYYQKTELLASFDVFGKMLAGAGLEARMPFGSRSVQEVTCRVPGRLKTSWRGTPKPLLVRIARRHLPREVVRWSKMSFGYPMAAWMRRGGPLAPYVRLLERDDARTREVLDSSVLRRVVAENERGLGNHGEGALFAAINLEIWLRVRVEGGAPSDILQEISELAGA